MAGGEVDVCNLLEPFKLSGVNSTGKILGQGAYARVFELMYRDLKCAGKKLLPELTGYSKQEQVAVLRRAREECVTLSRLKHPNIVQFLGVYFEEENPLPILVMEFVPFTLTRYIEKNWSALYPVMNYSILVDVAKALCYLHGGDQIIIHRDLTSNNVLLTSDMTAKVSDLGTAKMLNMSVSKKIHNFNKLSACPGTPAYMPPEARCDDSDYDETLDCFSYGILILHILCGDWPIPPETEYTSVLSEMERRKKYTDKVKDRHLMGLIEKCLESKGKRPSAKEILEEVRRVQQSFGPQPTKMTLLDQVKLDVDTRVDMKKEISRLEDEQSKLKTDLKRMQYLLFMEKQGTIAAKEAFETRIFDLKSEVDSRDSDKKYLEGHLHSEVKKHRKMEEEKEDLKRQTEEDIRAIKKLADEKMKQKEEELIIYKQQKDQEFDSYKRRKDDELSAKETELNHYKDKLLEKEKILDDIKARNEEQARKAHNDLHTYESQKGCIMEYLRSGTQMHPLHHRMKSLKWKEGPALPSGMTAPQYVLIKSTLYVGGGQTTNDENSIRHLLFEYSPPNDDNPLRNNWKCPFPPCPTKYFGLGELNEKVVVVGGEHDTEDNQTIITGEVFVVDESIVWRSDEIPAMITPRSRSCVVSYKGCIAACGGKVHGNKDCQCSSAVEVYSSGDKEWFAVNSLPKPRAALRVSIIHKTAYFVGGYFPSLASSGEPDCICIELEDLFQSDKGAQRYWNDEFHETPYKSSTPANLCGSLLALGGLSEGQTLRRMDTIYAYSPMVRDWCLIDKLPVQLSSATAITLSNGEIMVLGGKTSGGRSANVYIGSLEL